MDFDSDLCRICFKKWRCLCRDAMNLCREVEMEVVWGYVCAAEER